MYKYELLGEGKVRSSGFQNGACRHMATIRLTWGMVKKAFLQTVPAILLCGVQNPPLCCLFMNPFYLRQDPMDVPGLTSNPEPNPQTLNPKAKADAHCIGQSKAKKNLRETPFQTPELNPMQFVWTLAYYYQNTKYCFLGLRPPIYPVRKDTYISPYMYRYASHITPIRGTQHAWVLEPLLHLGTNTDLDPKP